ncbi:MAG: CRISPR-associated endonuclease Cas2 [Thermoprotei archaeon]
MYVLVVYDVSDNGARAKLADYLKSRGFTRIQRSVFIGNPLPARYKDVLRTIPRFIDRDSDVVHLFPLTEYSLRYYTVYGKPWADIPRGSRELVVIS